MTRLNNPTSPRKLRISRCGGIECILRSDGQASQISNTLEVIDLATLEDLKVVVQRGEIGAVVSTAKSPIFSYLKRLSISSCRKMRKVGLPAAGVPNLECIYIWECGEIDEIFEDEGRMSLAILPKLQKMYLEGLPRLRKVGLSVCGVPNLETITIWECEEIEEIFQEDEGRAASIGTTFLLPKLTHLRLEDLPRLKSLNKATIICNSIEVIPRLTKKQPVHFDDPLSPPT